MPSSTIKSGLTSQCRDCYREYARQHKDRMDAARKKWEVLHRESAKENRRRYFQSHKAECYLRQRQRYREHPERVRESNRLYRIKAKEHRKQLHDDYYRLNRDRIAEYCREFRLTHRELYRQYAQARRTRKMCLPSTLQFQDWLECLEYFSYSCAYCGSSFGTLTQDHVIPIVSGGGYTVDNIVPACCSCNSSKNAKEFTEWYRSREFYSPAREEAILAYLDSRRNKSAEALLRYDV